MTKKDRELFFRLAVGGSIIATVLLWNAGIPIQLSVALVVLVLVAIIVANHLRKKAYYRALHLSDVDNMTGTEFEHYVQQLLQWRGYRAKVTPASGDFGVDLIAQKDDTKYAVQAKCYRKQPVSVHAVGEVVGGMKHYQCTHSMVITNNYFTQPAKSLAESNDTVLVDRKELARWITEFTSGEQVKEKNNFLSGLLSARIVRATVAIMSMVLVVVLLAKPIRSLGITITPVSTTRQMETPTVQPTMTPVYAILAATVEPTPTLQPPATNVVLEATKAPNPDSDPLQISQKYTVTADSNLRTGPGTDYEISGGAKAGSVVSIVPCTGECDWLQLTSGEWIAGFLVTQLKEE